MAQRLDVRVDASIWTLANGLAGALDAFWNAAVGCGTAPGDWEYRPWCEDIWSARRLEKRSPGLWGSGLALTLTQ